jgi:hypothetical protein
MERPAFDHPEFLSAWKLVDYEDTGMRVGRGDLVEILLQGPPPAAGPAAPTPVALARLRTFAGAFKRASALVACKGGLDARGVGEQIFGLTGGELDAYWAETGNLTSALENPCPCGVPEAAAHFAGNIEREAHWGRPPGVGFVPGVPACLEAFMGLATSPGPDGHVLREKLLQDLEEKWVPFHLNRQPGPSNA